MHEDGTLERVEIGTPAEKAAVRTDFTTEERRALTDQKLNELLQTADGALLLACIKEAKDRDEGKPMQRLSASVTTRTVHLHIGAILPIDNNALVLNNSESSG